MSFTDVNIYLLLPEITLIGGAFVILFVDLIFRSKGEAFLTPLAIITLLVSGWFVANIGYETQTTVYDTFLSDSFAITLKYIILFGTLLIVLLADNYRPLKETSKAEFLTLLLFATSAMCFMVSSQDLILLYVSIEFSSIISYLLAGYLKRNVRSLESGIKYFLFGAVSSAIMLLGIGLLFSTSGITNIPLLIENLVSNGGVDPFILLIASGLFIVGLAYKIAAVPLHLWAPDVYEGAPTPITAYLSVASKAAGAAVFLRVVFWVTPTLGMATLPWEYILQFIAIASMLLGAIIGIMQNNLKRLLAYSSISHIGFVIVGVIVGRGIGDMSVVIYLVGYLFMNLGAFAIVSAYGSATDGYELSDYTGLIQRYPILATLLTVFLVSLAGIPPTVGFIAKFFIFSAAIKGELILLAIAGAISAVISLFMYARILKAMFLDKPTEKMLNEEKKHISVPAWVAMSLCIVGTLVFGVYPRPLVELAQFAVKGLG